MLTTILVPYKQQKRMNILRAYVKKIAEDKREEERILREKFR